MGCACSNPARVDREDRKDHVTRKTPFTNSKFRDLRTSQCKPSSSSRLALPPDNAAERNSAAATPGTDSSDTSGSEEGAHHERELNSNIGEQTSQNGIDSGIDGGVSTEVSHESVRKDEDSAHVNEQVSEGALARIASLREENPAPTRVSSITGEAVASAPLMKKELLLEAIRKAALAAEAAEGEEEEDDWTVEDSLENDADDMSALSPTSAARIRSLGLSLSSINEMSKSSPTRSRDRSTKARTSARVPTPVFDPSLLVQFEETFNEYTPTEWMNINRSGQPRRRSIEAWMKAEEKTKEVALCSKIKQASVVEAIPEIIVPNVSLKSPTSLFKERTMGGGRESRAGGGGYEVRRVKLGETRRRSSRFAEEDEARRSQESRRKSVEDQPLNTDIEDSFTLRMVGTP